MAVKNGHLEAARLLLENGANANTRYFFGCEINLIPPQDKDFLELLLLYGAWPDSRDRTGATPLMKACRIPQVSIESFKRTPSLLTLSIKHQNNFENPK